MSRTAVNDEMDRAIYKENVAMDKLNLMDKLPEVDEEKLKALNLAHIKHPWLQQNMIFLALKGKLFNHFKRLELYR